MFDVLLSSMTESTLSRVLAKTSARDVWVTLRKLDSGKHASTALTEGNEIQKQRCKDETSIEGHCNKGRLLVPQYRAVGETMSDVNVALAILRTFNDSATYKGIIITIRVSTKLKEVVPDEIEPKMMVKARDIDMKSKLESCFGACGHLQSPHCGRTDHAPERCWIKYFHKRRKRRLESFPRRRA